MDTLVQTMILDSRDEFATHVALFLEEYDKRTSFQELNDDDLREKLWETLFHYLSDDASSSLRHSCLATLRILSRDKTGLERLISDDRIRIVLKGAALYDVEQTTTYDAVTIESLKLLSNLLFNSKTMQQSIVKTSCLQCLIKRMKTYNEDVPYNVKLFDMIILFLITALNVSTRRVAKTELGADDCLIKMLDDLAEATEENTEQHVENVNLSSHILKALFNLYIEDEPLTQEEEQKIRKLVRTLRKLLTRKYREEDDDLQSNIVNILTVLPCSCYSSLIPVAGENCQNVYENVDMTAVSALLNFLDRRLKSRKELAENLSPVLTAFVRLTKTERLIRKYVRLQILAPLRDVMHRPEEGTTLRAKLCKMLTCPVTEQRDLVAEFLFVLCKENVGRMVKYTGYGNAAGMFANKGLMGSQRRKPAYSSDSEDSDTEEYLKHKEHINPVTGCYEPPKPSPLEGMSEEQKEYEALQLVGLVDKLAKQGLVQPCRIGDDGRPRPIEHVLELQEQLPKQQYTRQDSD